MRMPMQVDTVRMAELLTYNRASEHAAGLITALRASSDWATMLAHGLPDELEHARRAASYQAASDAIEKLTDEMNEALRRAGVDDDFEHSVEARANAKTDPPPAPPRADANAACLVGSHADELADAAGERGDKSAVLSCPKCGSGRFVDRAGICSHCGTLAIDTRDPKDPDGSIVCALCRGVNGEHANGCTFKPSTPGGEVVRIEKDSNDG